MPPAVQSQKRATGACQNCRRRKAKCSGTQPCNSCQRLGKECIFHEDRRISVSRREFHALKRKVEQLQSQNAASLDKQSSITQPLIDLPTQAAHSPGSSDAHSLVNVHDRHESGPEEARGTDAFLDHNPLASPSSFVHRGGTRQRAWFFQGPTSSWSFTHRVLRRIAVCFGATIDLPLTTDGDVYQLPWEDKGPGDMPDVSDLPSYERALYLMSTIKYHLDDLFQLYDEEEFLSHLHELYDDVHRKVGTSRLWYIQYLMVLALGEAFLSPSRRKDGNPGGCQYFTRAMSLLPNLTKVWDDPILAIEVLTAVALYLYSVDMRDSSSCYIGQAMRIALIEGLHRALPPDIDPKFADRCTRVWWTVYMLENKITASEGVPSAIRDEDITATLWDPRHCSRSAAGLTLHVKVTQAMARVLLSVYRPDEEGQATPFLRKVQSSLRHMANFSREWEQVARIRFKSSVGAMSGLSTRLELSYHQCVIITIRPLIFSLLLECLDSVEKRTPPRPLSPTVQTLVQVCVDAAAKSLKLLGKLHDKNLLETFLPFDLEYTFAAVFALRLVSVVVPRELIQIPSCTDATREIVGDYIAIGSRIAVFRQAELDALDCLLSRLCSLTPVAVPINFSMSELSGVSGSSLKDQSMASDHHLDSTLDGNSSAGGDWGSHGEGMGLLSDQILSVVDQLAVDDFFVDSSIVNMSENRRWWDAA